MILMPVVRGDIQRVRYGEAGRAVDELDAFALEPPGDIAGLARAPAP